MDLRLEALLIAAVVALGCGDSSGHPDTGAGAGGTPSEIVDCTRFCARAASCAVTLCNEDTNSTMFSNSAAQLERVCVLNCSETAVQSITLTDWQCYWTASCRQVFEHDACHQQLSYTCG